MKSNLKHKDEQDGRASDSPSLAEDIAREFAEAHARKMLEFRRRAKRISRRLEGRTHSDSAKLLSEDRQR
jgi:hypothetical protein